MFVRPSISYGAILVYVALGWDDRNVGPTFLVKPASALCIRRQFVQPLSKGGRLTSHINFRQRSSFPRTAISVLGVLRTQETFLIAWKCVLNSGSVEFSLAKLYDDVMINDSRRLRIAHDRSLNFPPKHSASLFTFLREGGANYLGCLEK